MVRVSRRVEKNHFVSVLGLNIKPHCSCERSSLELLLTVPTIMATWNQLACLNQGDGLKRGTRNTAANLRPYTDIPENLIYADFKLQETPQDFRHITALTVRMRPSPNSNLTARNWFHSLPSQRFHALLTLFPKSFSPFPHGTCLLSVSGRYLALGDKYLPFSAPLPKYATL